MLSSKTFVHLLIAGTAFATSLADAADTGRGANLYDELCAECHSLKPGKHKKGPSLAGVFGRPAATMDDFEYSDGLKKSGVTWTADKLDAYLAEPKKTYPDIKMKFDGMPNAKDRADLIGFFQTQR